MVDDKRSTSNWLASESDYQTARRGVLESVASKDVAAAPFPFMDRQTVTAVLARIELFKKILDVQGSIVECGVHKGNSLFLYYHLSTILEPFAFNRKIIGFDTFEGFRSITAEDDPNLSENDFSDTSYELLKNLAELQDRNRPVPHIGKLELVKGDAVETIPAFVRDNPHLIIALLYLDFDIYKPTAVALEHLLPLVPRGGIVAFDELNSEKWAGETVALKERLKLSELRLQKIHFDPWVSYYVVE